MKNDSPSPQVEAIRELGQSIAKITNGGNYVASFWCDELPDAHTVDQAISAINQQYTKSRLQKEDITPVKDWPAAWQEIADCIWYGVDTNDGVEANRPLLTLEVIDRLRQYRDRMKILLNTLVDDKARLYTFGWSQRLHAEIDLDDYIVMWAYRFIVLNPDGTAYLLHGSSSD